MTTREETIRLARENIVNLFNKAGESAGWKPGFGNDLVINYLTHFYHLAIEDFLNRSGQYLTNDASREAAIQLAKNEAYKEAARLVMPSWDKYECEAAILALVKE